MLTPTPATPMSRARDLAERTQRPAHIYAEELPKVYAVGGHVYHETRHLVSSDAALPLKRIAVVDPRPASFDGYGS